MRLFVAFDLSETVRARLAAFLRELERSESSAAAAAVKWVKPESLHLTLKFIGEQPEEKLPAVMDALSSIPTPAPLELSFRGFGCFPNERQPRVFWVGVEAPPDLGALAGSIEAALEPLGIAREQRAYSPHLTLGRLKDGAGRTPALRLRSLVEVHRASDFGRDKATEFYLYVSRISSAGPQYTKLKAFPLRPPASAVP